MERDLPTIAPRRQGSDEERFDRYLREEAQEVFQAVMGKLFRELRDGGQSEPEAQRNAEQFARMHLRHRFRQEHPESSLEGQPTSLERILRKE